MFFNKPKHIIFLIHGIGGNKTHFGHMSRALARALNKLDHKIKYIVKSVEYETGHDEKTPYDFAKDINKVIHRFIDSPRFKSADKFSFIMHSQGGLIGSIWMLQSLMSSPGYSTPQIVKRLDSFITLGTPFWGAKTAQWGAEIKALTEKLGVKVPLPFGKRELEEMSFGSDMIFDFRMAMIDPQYKEHIEYLREKVRFLNIVGVADVLNPIGIFVSGTSKYEDDGAVPLSCARFDFYYTQSINQDYDDGDKISLDFAEEIKLAPYVIVNAMHLSPLPDNEKFYGIAQVPRACVNDENIKHPTFQYLWRHILGEKVQQMDEALGDFKTFLLDINVRVIADRLYQCEDIKIDISKLDGSKIEKSNIEMTKAYELYAKGARASKQYPNLFRYYYTGTIKRRLENRTEAVLLKIFGKDLKSRHVEMKLAQGCSSFVDVELRKF